MGCPRCGSLEVRRSHRTRFERVASVVCYRPHRCMHCGHRFWRPVLPAFCRPLCRNPTSGHVDIDLLGNGEPPNDAVTR